VTADGSETQLEQIAAETYGIRIVVEVGDSTLVPQVRQLLPPGWTETSPDDPNRRFTVTVDDAGLYGLEIDGGTLAGQTTADIVVTLLESQLREYVALEAPERIFVHAGVVAIDGRALVLPGKSLSGKSTLVAELVRAGATYYSDEYAVLDPDGRVHPFAAPLSIRGADDVGVGRDVSEFGGVAADVPATVAVVAASTYRPDAAWEPTEKSPGEGVLLMLANTVPAQDRPDEALSAIRRALDSAVVLEGTRGDAAETAPLLLRALADSA
jgi:hypothetical protein